MRERIVSEPSFAMGMVVWLVAATAFPWHLGLAGVSLSGLAVYLVIAGGLLAIADAVLNAEFYRRWSDVALQGLFWAIGLSVPAAVLFTLGGAAAPAAEEIEDNLCAMAGLSNPADHTEPALEEALEPGEDCEVG